jgi:hypothetical protein
MGVSSPDMVASAPDGVDDTLIVSVVPRVTDAQPPSMAHSAMQLKIRMKLKSPTKFRGNQAQPELRFKGVCQYGAEVSA